MSDIAVAADKPSVVSRGRMAKFYSGEAQRKAGANFQRAQYVKSRGHDKYIRQAKRNDRFYLGAGLQWELDDVEALAADKKKPVEDNKILQMVNTAIGYQIANRMDISVRPRGHGADDESAKIMGKTVKYVADDTKLHWVETDVFSNGVIMQRGYFDIRMNFEQNVLGEIECMSLDPLDVMPDPDARAYDPKYWSDVTVERYMTLNHIERHFGKEARDAVKNFENPETMASIVDHDGHPRNSFGDNFGGGIGVGYIDGMYGNDDSCGLYRVIDRQYRTYEMTQCAVYPTGDIRMIPNASKEQLAEYEAQGAIIAKRMQPRVRWCVSTMTVLLFDDLSMYPWFTVVPFFPFFRGGLTRGLVDNAISPQEVLNKGLSQFIHIINTEANSGWIIEQNSLTVSMDQFKRDASQNGIVIEYKKGFEKPEKIRAGQIPAGVNEFIAHAERALQSSTGIDDVLTSSGPVNEMSGVAYQARQYAAQQKLAVPLDNLARTRDMVATIYVGLIQMYFDTPRVLRIVETDAMGEEVTSELSVNEPQQDAAGNITRYLNDLTLGEYSLVISEQPMQITFDNSQFEQCKSLATDFGYRVPASVALRYSSLADRTEIAKAIEDANAAQPNPVEEAKAALMKAQAAKTAVDTVDARIKAVYGSTQAAVQIATIPQVASIADEILQSAGFVDQNQTPIIPQGMQTNALPGAGLAAVAPEQPLLENTGDPNGPAPENTHPLSPANPGMGMTTGLEAQGPEYDQG